MENLHPERCFFNYNIFFPNTYKWMFSFFFPLFSIIVEGGDKATEILDLE